MNILAFMGGCMAQQARKVSPSSPTPASAPVVAAAAAAATATDAVHFSKEALEGKTAPELIRLFGSKSNAIREMAKCGLKTGEIAKQLGVIYQHARNVLNRPLKREIKAEREAHKSVTSAVK
jgi:hypothetical protein